MPMRHPALHSYLSRLPQGSPGDARLWVAASGEVRGQFFNCSLASQFRPARDLGGEIRAFDASAHSSSAEDQGLLVWHMLNDAASDDESIELDRLCRMIHVLNFFRQVEDDDTALMMGVHERLLAAVSSNHGAVFGRILDALQLPRERILLQLPQAGADRQWLIGHVVDNYRRNGFRIATRAASADEALRQVMQLRPDLVRIDSGALEDAARLAELLAQAEARAVQLLFSGVDAEADLRLVDRALALADGAARSRIWTTSAAAGAPDAALAGIPRDTVRQAVRT